MNFAALPKSLEIPSPKTTLHCEKQIHWYHFLCVTCIHGQVARCCCSLNHKNAPAQYLWGVPGLRPSGCPGLESDAYASTVTVIIKWKEAKVFLLTAQDGSPQSLYDCCVFSAFVMLTNAEKWTVVSSQTMLLNLYSFIQSWRDKWMDGVIQTSTQTSCWCTDGRFSKNTGEKNKTIP